MKFSKPYYNHYIKSDIWRNKCKVFLQEAGNQCFKCHKTENLEVHHLHYLTLGFETSSDVLVVCKVCHTLEHKLIKIADANARKPKVTFPYAMSHKGAKRRATKNKFINSLAQSRRKNKKKR